MKKKMNRKESVESDSGRSNASSNRSENDYNKNLSMNEKLR
jgi:hypothetical protein